MAKILVVDDEQVLVKGIKFNLEHEGYQVEVGYDGEQAVELAREGSFDLILLDVIDLRIPGSYIVSFVVKAPNGGVFAMSAKEGDTCVECNPVDPGGEF